MKKKVHRKISKKTYPWADDRVIEIVNSILGDPPWWLSLIPQIARIPKLKYQGHRASGHDMIGAALAGLIYGGRDGLLIAPLHLLLDWIRDWIVRRYGVNWADWAEDTYLVLEDLLGKKRGKKVKR